jgi:hypothetical protein
VAFDAAEFERYLAARAEHLQKIHRTLQVSGQAAFAVHYDDLFDDAVIEGLASFLGAPGDQKSLRKQGKIQNPKPLSAKVSNFGEMTRALANRDPFNLDRLAIYEPRRGPNVPAFVTARTAPLLYLPIKCADDQRVLAWMARLDGIDPGEMASGHNQKTLRQWMRKTRRHTSFSVISHPLARAHQAFCRHILSDGDAAYPAIRNVLRRSYKLPIPDDANDPSYDLSAHHDAFLAFLTFLEGNLGGQTSIRVDGAWATQTAVLQGMATIIVPQKVVHSDDLIEGLTELCAPFEAKVPDLPKPKPYFRFRLEDIYDEVLEKAARRAYRRDFMMFGFESWR